MRRGGVGLPFGLEGASSPERGRVTHHNLTCFLIAQTLGVKRRTLVSIDEPASLASD
jgi:hypothetical protein